jgi:hypothetical protein
MDRAGEAREEGEQHTKTPNIQLKHLTQYRRDRSGHQLKTYNKTKPNATKQETHEDTQ